MILIIGSANMDFSLKVNEIPRSGETVLATGTEKSPGGKGSNQAVAAAKLGGDVTFISCVGDDGNGKLLLESLNQAGVNTQYVLEKNSCISSSAYICVSDAGENTIVVDSSANKFISSEYLLKNEGIFKRADFCILQMEIPAETVRTAMELCHKYRVKIVFNPSPVKGVDEKMIKGIDFLIPNENEAEALIGKAFERCTDTDCLDFMGKHEIQHMIITLGEKGCCYYQLGKCVARQYPAQVKRAVDTTGAGDTFLGAFVAALENNCTIEKAICFANTASGIKVTRYGAQQAMPRIEEVENELKECFA